MVHQSIRFLSKIGHSHSNPGPFPVYETMTQCALPNAETAAMLFWALMASGQIAMRRVDGWQTLDQAPVEQPLDLAA